MSTSSSSLATPERRERALAALRATANVSEAARRAGVARMTLYRWREADPAFAEAWDDAVETAVDALEAAAWARARDGVARPIVRDGAVVGEFRQHSDGLMMFLLRALRPERYRADTAADRRAAREAEKPIVVELLRFPAPEDEAQARDGASEAATEGVMPGAGPEMVPERDARETARGPAAPGTHDGRAVGGAPDDRARDRGSARASLATPGGDMDADDMPRADTTAARHADRPAAPRVGVLPPLDPLDPYEGRQMAFEGADDWDETWA